MSLRPQDADALHAIVDSTDPTVTMSHRLRAIELLAEYAEHAPSAGGLAIAKWMDEMTDAEVETEIMARFPPDVREGRRAAGLEGREAELRRRERRVVELERQLDEREARLSAAQRPTQLREATPAAEPRDPSGEPLQAPQVEPPPGVEPGAGFGHNGRRRPLR